MTHLRRDGSPRPDGRTDFRRALTPGETFESSDGDYLVRQVLAGELVLPSGRIIATDPCYLSSPTNTPAFVRTVPPGTYPVWLAMARRAEDEHWGELVACLALQLSEAAPVQWEMALRPGEQLANLTLGEFYGHGVDSGNACFVDSDLIAGLDQAALRSLYMDGVVASYEQHNWRVRSVNVPLPGPAQANLIACSSGYGDGTYPSWWGYDDTGHLCALVTDFLVLVEDLTAEARFPLRDWADRTLIHPDLPRIGARVSLSAISPGARDLHVVIDGNEMCEVAVVDGAGQTCCSGGRHTIRGDRSEHFLTADELFPDDAVLVLSYSLGTRSL